MSDLEGTQLLLDPTIKKIVTALDTASLSILELLEYDLTRTDISHALASEVIVIDKSSKAMSAQDYLVSGDVYFNEFLNGKVRLTELGKSLLEQFKNQK